MGKKTAAGLGRTLLRERSRARGGRAAGAGWLHTSELSDRGSATPQSVTEPSSLEEFLATAELAGTEFVAEKLNVRIVPVEARTGVLPAEEAGEIQALREQNKELLCIPRRPQWDEQMSPAVLHQAERDGFLKWRRQLAQLEEEQKFLLTPFERNLDFWRQLWRVLERSDVVVQIVDARNPSLFRCEDLERYAKELSPEKENLILLNKGDLLSEEQRSAWARFFEKEGLRAIFWSALAEGKQTKTAEMPDPIGESGSGGEEQLASRQPGGRERGGDPEADSDVYEDCREEEEAWLTCSEDGESGPTVVPWQETRTEVQQPGPPQEHPLQNCSRLVRRDELLEIFKAVHAGKKRVREGELTVGLVGYPNVGKSSTINAILGKKKASVSATPGHTKHFQTLYVEPALCLCDSPGLVMPSFVSNKAEMICSGILPVDQMRDHVPAVTLVCQRIPRAILEATYGIGIVQPLEHEASDRPPTSEELLSAYGCMRGFMTDHGQPDQPRSARHVLKDYVAGKLLYCHAPPGMDSKTFQQWHRRLCPGREAAQPNEARLAGRDAKKKPTGHTVDLDFFHQQELLLVNQTCAPDACLASKENHRALISGSPAGLGCRARAAALQDLPGPDSAGRAGKPWKKHGNRNKKEKLRRRTKHLEA